MTIGIIVAMEKELKQLQSLFNNQEVIVRQSGIGKVNAAIGAAEMIRSCHPDCIISSGCAGGADTSLNVQDIVVSTQLCYHDVYCGNAAGGTVYGQVQGMPARFDADPQLLAVASSIESDHRIVPGLIVTGDWFVDSKDKMRDIVRLFPDAAAVDMESAAIAQTCHTYGVPFISFRVISDIPLRDTHAAMYHDFWANVAQQSFQTTRTLVEKLFSMGA